MKFNNFLKVLYILGGFILTYIFLITGFLLLFIGADFFVSSAANISKTFNINPFFMGLTIVAFGTSSPELSVSLISSLNGSYGLCVGNIIGSNLFNILMVVGALGFIKTLRVDNSILKMEFLFLIFCSITLLLLSMDNSLGRFDGILLLLLFTYYMFSFSPINNYRESIPLIRNNIIKFKDNTKFYDILINIFSLLAIFTGGKMVVDSCLNIVDYLDISSRLIGFTIVAIGTSLPELITSIIASCKNEGDIALGSIIGSNIFNILFVIAIPALINPIAIDSKLISDCIFTIIATILAFIFIKRKNDITKHESLILVFTYIIYIQFFISKS